MSNERAMVVTLTFGWMVVVQVQGVQAAPNLLRVSATRDAFDHVAQALAPNGYVTSKRLPPRFHELVLLQCSMHPYRTQYSRDQTIW